MHRHRVLPLGLSMITLLALTACTAGDGASEAEPAEAASAQMTQPATDAPDPTGADSTGTPVSSGEPVPSPSSSLTSIPTEVPAEGLILVAKAPDDSVTVAAMDPEDPATIGIVAEFPDNNDSPLDFGGDFGSQPLRIQSGFSPDYTRIVASRVDPSNQDPNKIKSHYGWLEATGEFVNVTGPLAADSGEFTRGVSYSSGWFDEEGNYRFESSPASDGGSLDPTEQYMIAAGQGPEAVESTGAPLATEDPSDIECIVTVAGELSADHPWCDRRTADPEGWSAGYGFGLVTDWINDTEYITSTDTMIFRDATKVSHYDDENVKKLLPETERTVYSAVVSPDGTQIAFLSPQVDDPTNVELFIVPADGSAAPQRVELMDATFDDTIRIADWK
jgi:hypothetical protein